MAAFEDIAGSLNIAEGIARFLRDFGGYAMAALFLLGYVKKDREARVSEKEKFELAMSIAPLSEALVEVLEHVAVQARVRAHASKPPLPAEELNGP